MPRPNDNRAVVAAGRISRARRRSQELKCVHRRMRALASHSILFQFGRNSGKAFTRRDGDESRQLAPPARGGFLAERRIPRVPISFVSANSRDQQAVSLRSPDYVARCAVTSSGRRSSAECLDLTRGRASRGLSQSISSRAHFSSDDRFGRRRRRRRGMGSGPACRRLTRR